MLDRGRRTGVAGPAGAVSPRGRRQITVRPHSGQGPFQVTRPGRATVATSWPFGQVPRTSISCPPGFTPMNLLVKTLFRGL